MAETGEGVKSFTGFGEECLVAFGLVSFFFPI